MKWLAIFYDDHCGLCTRVRGWLAEQPVFVPLRFCGLHAPNLRSRFPGIEAFSPEEKLMVMSDDGSVWRGDGAWIMVLWALREGRELSLKMASPALRPLARKVVTAVSENRLKLSRWLGLDLGELQQSAECVDGSCKVPPPLPQRRGGV